MISRSVLILLALTGFADAAEPEVYQCIYDSGKNVFQGQGCSPEAVRKLQIRLGVTGIIADRADREPTAHRTKKVRTFPFNETSFLGSWCQFESETNGASKDTKILFVFKNDGEYLMRDGTYQQAGLWNYADGMLQIDNVGKYDVVAVDENAMRLKHDGYLNLKAGECK